MAGCVRPGVRWVRAASPVAACVCSVLNSLSYGSLWVAIFDMSNSGRSIPAADHEKHGLTLSVVYSALNVAPAVGPMVADVLSGRLYDR